MKGSAFGLCMAAVGLVMAGPAHAELMSFESDFTSWSGTDADATSPVSSSTGHTPASDWTVTYDGATGNAAPGWLTQGDIGGTPTTAYFLRTDTANNARARFSAALPAEWVYKGLQDTTLQVDFKLRCISGYEAGGGPIQISYPTVYGMFTAYIRVRNQGAQIRPLDGGTTDVKWVGSLSRPLGSEWHSWTVKVTYGEYADYGDGPKHWAYWDLYLDGEQLFFSGDNGSPWFNGHHYSFRTAVEKKSSYEPEKVPRGDAKIGLGEMRNERKVWAFEFDYVNFSADVPEQPPLTELYRWSFDTTGDAENWNCNCHPLDPDPACDEASAGDITQQDTYGAPPVFVNLMGRDPADWPWGGVNPTEGGALRVVNPGGYGMWLVNGVKLDLGLTDDVMAIEFNLSRTSAIQSDVWVDFYIRAPGDPWHWARLRSKRLTSEGSNQFDPWKWNRVRFTLDEFKNMELVIGHRWWENPGTYELENLNGLFAVNFVFNLEPLFIDDIRLYGLPCGFVAPEDTQAFTVPKVGTADPIVYTFTHTGAGGVSYTVQESDADGDAQDYPWLSLDKEGGGPLASGQSDPVTVMVDPTDMIPDTYTAYIAFVDTCDPANTHIRRMDVTIVGCQAEVSPSTQLARSWIKGSASPVPDAVFTVRNAGQDGLSYTVVEVVDCPWLSLDKAGGGPLDYQQTDAVTATIDPAGLAVGVHTCTLRFTDSCTPVVEHERDVVLSVLDASIVLEQFDAPFVEFTNKDVAAESPFEPCDPRVVTGNKFDVTDYGGEVPGRVTDYLTQGSIEGTPTTAKFYDPQGSYYHGYIGFDGHLPFDESYDPAKGMVVAWRVKVAHYTPSRGAIQIMAPSVPGPYTGDVNCYHCYIRLANGTRVRIKNNDGNHYGNIDELLLDTPIANEYHQWTAAVCYDSGTDAAYWKLWLDGELLLFGGSDGSVVGPAGETYSFRTTSTENRKLCVRLGDNTTAGTSFRSTFDRGWDFEFDYVRALSLGVAGSPFWDGEGCVAGCPDPFADADEDGDVDQSDFAAFQVCMTGDGGTLDPVNCACFDRDGDEDVDDWDLADFEACATGPGILWAPTPECP